MYISALRLVNLGRPKASIQLLRMQMHTPHMQAKSMSHSSKLDFAISVFCPTVKQLVPKLQHLIPKTASLMCKASRLCDSVW